jgi:hypothetical protein
MKRLSVFGVGLILCGAAQAQDPAVAREPNYSLATTSALLRFPGSPFDALRRYGVSIEGSITNVYQVGLSGSGDKRWQLGGKGDLFVTPVWVKMALFVFLRMLSPLSSMQ